MSETPEADFLMLRDRRGEGRTLYIEMPDREVVEFLRYLQSLQPGWDDEQDKGIALWWGSRAYETGTDDDGDPIVEEEHRGIGVYEHMPEALGQKGEAAVINCLVAHANKTLPPGTRYEIRKRIPGNYGREHGMAWYRTPEMDKAEHWEEMKLGVDRVEFGYFLIGQLTTPKAA